MDFYMKRISAAFLVTSIALAGCGGGSGGSSASVTVLDAEIEGTWNANTCSDQVTNDWLTNGSDNETWFFEGSKLTITTTTYWGPDCTGGTYEVSTYVANIEIGSETTSLDGEAVKTIKTTIADNSFQFYNQDKIDEMAIGLSQNCGFIPSVGQVVHESDCSGIPSEDRNVGHKAYGLYQVDGDLLHTNFAADDYPDNLNKDSIFSEQLYR